MVEDPSRGAESAPGVLRRFPLELRGVDQVLGEQKKYSLTLVVISLSANLVIVTDRLDTQGYGGKNMLTECGIAKIEIMMFWSL